LWFYSSQNDELDGVFYLFKVVRLGLEIHNENRKIIEPYFGGCGDL
jgi:hypothetical protein